MTNIVMLVCNRLRLTEQALKSLYDHTDWREFNLTVVDTSDDFRVEKLLTKYLTKGQTEWLKLPFSSPVLSRFRNVGAYWSKQVFGEGDWLYFSDNDVYFKPGWLGQLTMAARVTELNGYSLWGGQVHPFHLRPETVGYICLKYQESDHTVHPLQVLDGPSWLLRWWTWDSFGPLKRDTAPGTCQSEEYPFCESLIDSGRKIGVLYPHCVIHTGLTNTQGMDTPGRELRETHKIPGVIYE